jgi:hypothetical protein
MSCDDGHSSGVPGSVRPHLAEILRSSPVVGRTTRPLWLASASGGASGRGDGSGSAAWGRRRLAVGGNGYAAGSCETHTSSGMYALKGDRNGVVDRCSGFVSRGHVDVKMSRYRCPRLWTIRLKPAFSCHAGRRSQAGLPLLNAAPDVFLEDRWLTRAARRQDRNRRGSGAQALLTLSLIRTAIQPRHIHRC